MLRPSAYALLSVFTPLGAYAPVDTKRHCKVFLHRMGQQLFAAPIGALRSLQRHKHKEINDQPLQIQYLVFQ